VERMEGALCFVGSRESPDPVGVRGNQFVRLDSKKGSSWGGGREGLEWGARDLRKREAGPTSVPVGLDCSL